ncbi:unnamed protein product, partial [Symbiodinium sp. KB8]
VLTEFLTFYIANGAVHRSSLAPNTNVPTQYGYPLVAVEKAGSLDLGVKSPACPTVAGFIGDEAATTNGVGNVIDTILNPPRMFQPSDVFGIAVDVGHDMVFWSSDYKNGSLGEYVTAAHRDGSGRHTIITNLNDPAGVAVNPSAQALYVVERRGQRLQQCGYDGSGCKTLQTFGGPQFPTDVAVD